MAGQENLILSRAGVLVKRKRRRYWDQNDFGIRYSKRYGKPEAGLWFRTRGCHHDLAGGCIMCDYGAGLKTKAEQMVEYVRVGLSTLPKHLSHLLVSPLGSFLDSWEVPETARLSIIRLMENTEHDTFSFESRAETITDEALEACRSILKTRPIKVYVGLESANPWVSKYCINKALSFSSYTEALELLHSRNMCATTNVLVGAPFLTTAQVIDDCVNTVQQALLSGSEECCLFPVHVKRWTLLHWLYQNGLYSPPSLWSLVEVIRRLGPQTASRQIEIAWYTSYGAPDVTISPTTCPNCVEKILRYLDGFAETNDYEWIDKLTAVGCQCKLLWQMELERKPEDNCFQRTATAYEHIGQELLGSSWWRLNSEAILGQMSQDKDYLRGFLVDPGM